MEIKVFDKTFAQVGVIDDIQSMIWTDRFDEAGDFELFTPVRTDLISLLQPDYYLGIDDSEHTMIVESREIDTDAERGDVLIVRGRSLESILDRRHILWKTVLNSGIQSALYYILDDQYVLKDLGDPYYRRIQNLVFQPTTDTRITSQTVKAQYKGQSIYDVFVNTCQEHKIGFKIILDNTGTFTISLYMGEDRSFDQSENPPVVFSHNIDNLLSSNYFYTKKIYKTYAIIYYEDLTDPAYIVRGTTETYLDDEGPWYTKEGLDHRELWVDASDMEITRASSIPTSPELTTFYNELYKRGRESLIENGELDFFDGSVELNGLYRYGVDFFLGDIIQIEDKYGNAGRAKVTEVIITENPSGHYVIPTFSQL